MTAAPFSTVFFEGRFMDPSEARVSIVDRGYQLGEGVFATLRGYDGACFRPERHLAHFARGAEAFGLALPFSVADLAALADEAAVRTGAADAYVRVTLARGADLAHPVLSILARSFDVPTEDDYAHGIPTMFVGPRRMPPACMDPTIKTTSYGAQVLARREASARGLREGLQLAYDGSLACGTMANVFLVHRTTLLTPSTASGCRAGVTREAVLELAAREGLQICEDRIDPAAIFDADEAFFTSTRLECLPIASIDGRMIGRAPGAAHNPWTTTLRSALRAVIRDETEPRKRSARRTSGDHS